VRAATLAAALLALGILPAAAATPPAATPQGPPATLPGRDVDVTYQVTAPGHELTQRMRWDVADHLLRVDPPSPGLYMVMDYARHEISMVQVQAKRVLQASGVGMAIPGATPGNAPFTRAGSATIAGLPCTNWQTKDAAGQPTEVCLTDDGVLLRARIGGHTAMVARSVDYAAQPASVFALPAGWPRETLPQQQR
jgi:hypothetical protein